ncbi:MAG: GGDEF domain-containing protein, partial [Gammaproteobacteria bacterium]|nr:GGDEF domain-containing protein [Gammaproteobacteria bacterium]
IIFILDQKGKFTFLNQTVNNILDYEPKELIGKPLEHIVKDGDLPQIQYTLNQITQYPEHRQIIEVAFLKKSANDYACFDLELMAIHHIYSETLLSPQANIKRIEHNHSSPEQIITGIYGVARDITEKKRYEQKLSHQLYYDNVTKLPNRLLFLDRLNNHIHQSQRLEKPFAIIYLDIDRFRKINDLLGRKYGDQLLKYFSEILNSGLRSSDTLARVSSNGFLILLPIFKNSNDIVNLIIKIQQKFAKPLHINGHDIYINFSCGIAVYPEHGEQADTLIKHAEMSMYHCKNTQPGQYKFFSTNFGNHFQSSLTIENDIRNAISNDEFEVYFQPQINIQTNKLFGVEALIRWNHPEKGMIYPDAFIPVAEESQLICDLGHWMIVNSMKIKQEWNKNPQLEDIRLAINISANQFSQTEFCNLVLNAMTEHNLDGNQIELEITENVLLENVDEVIEKLKTLGKHGIKFAIDDFGMGYSSLSYLQKLPLNNLKIDRAFISPIQESSDSNSIISAIVSMAKEMDMEIVVEGVENEIQLNYVQNLGCPIVQGYYFAKPMNAKQSKEFALNRLT